MNNKLRIVEWFGGIGAFSASLRYLDIEHEIVDYVELDKYCVKAFNILNNTNFIPTDINDVDVNKYNEIDILVAGWPCTDVSNAGKQKGLIESERSSLIWTTIKKINLMVSKPKYILLENVKGILSKKFANELEMVKNEFEKIGYNWSQKLLNAKDFNIPQNRERVYIWLTRKNLSNLLVLENTLTLGLQKKLKDFLDLDADVNIIDLNECKESSNFFNIPTNKEIEVQNNSYNRVWKDDKICGTLNLTSPIKIGNKIYFINEMKQYKDFIIEVDLNKLNNQDNYNINIVAKIVNAKFQQDKSFNGIDGISNTIISTNSDFKSKIIFNDKQLHKELTKVVGVNGIDKCLTSCGNTNEQNKIVYLPHNQNGNYILNNNNSFLYYRALTPRECWRLMGFIDSDIDKVINEFSKSKFCKMAGNSIVTNVLQSIIKCYINEKEYQKIKRPILWQ